MNRIRCGIQKRFRGSNGIAQIVAVCAAFFAVGCTVYTKSSVSPELPRLATKPAIAGPKNLFIFFDGTKNSPGSETNVWRSYKIVSEYGNSNTKSIYIEGVGNTRNPLTGMLFGFGMEKRVNQAYRFLANEYEQGAKIYIFGFSRGAHQARNLAGIISHAGVPKNQAGSLSWRQANRIIQTVKLYSDKRMDERWYDWAPGSPPPLATEVKKAIDLMSDPVKIAFVGVWDTVPGSFFKSFDGCKEESKGAGDRYKLGSYPPIEVMAQALALDEKRSRFSPLRLCMRIDDRPTGIHEKWFPGAHADVGGGYRYDPKKEGSLANAPLNWIITQLLTTYSFSETPKEFEEDPSALAHWSVGDSPANWFSFCRNRNSEGGERHDSFKARADLPDAQLMIEGKLKRVPYPKECS